MDDLYYIPLTKEGKEFFQINISDFEMNDFHVKNYKNIIDEYFIEDEGIVNLKTGKYHTKIFRTKNPKDGLYHCLVNKDNYPDDNKEILLEENRLEEIKNSLSIKVRTSEGIISDQIIDILANFVTPKIKFSDSSKEFFYHPKYFKNNFIIFGPPGSGKTTILRRLTLDFIFNSIENENRLTKIPIYIQLRDFNYYSNDFDTYIDNCIKNSFADLDFYNKYNFFKSGNLCLMLDGADEIDFEKFNNFKNTINNFKNKNPLVSLIITSRPDRNYENIEDFRKCYVQPFNMNQIKELTFRKLSKGNNWKDFISILNTTPEIYDILKNPLLLTISHFLFLHKSILPINSGQLIKELVATLVSNWDSQRNIERKLANRKVSPIEINNILGKLSLLFSELQKDSLSINEIFPVFKNFDTKSVLETYLDYINFSTGIIKKDNNNNWSFTHKSIQDYFCSSYLVESVGKLKEKLFIDKDWDEILIMISGLSSDPNYIIQCIFNGPTRTETDKLKNCLSVFNESHLLSKQDIKDSFKLLESFMLKFEKLNNLTEDKIKIGPNNIDIKIALETKGFKEILALISIIFKTRFTKYEYDFHGYLNSSKSNILKSISNMSLEKGNITIVSDKNNTIIRHREESPEIE